METWESGGLGGIDCEIITFAMELNGFRVTMFTMVDVFHGCWIGADFIDHRYLDIKTVG